MPQPTFLDELALYGPAHSARSSPALAAALWVAGLPTPVSAQRPLFSSGVDVVRVGVSVLDDEGKPLTGLTRDDFDVYEDGARHACSDECALGEAGLDQECRRR